MNITTRQLLFVVPALIAFLSAYWFRKKRKLKALADANSNLHINANSSSVTEKAEVQNVTDTSSITSPDHELIEKHNSSTDDCDIHSAETQNCESYSHTNGHATMLESCHTSVCDDSGVELQKLEDSDIRSIKSLSPEKEGNGSLVREMEDLMIEEEVNSGASKTAENMEVAITESFEQEVIPANASSETETNGSYIDFVENKPTESENVDIASDSHLEAKEDVCDVINNISESFCGPISNTSDNADRCEESSVEIVANDIDRIEGEIQNSDSLQKSSPTSTGSPVSHSNDAGSDCEALSSVGTSSISLSELFSTSPVDSMKEQTNFQIDEEASIDSGKGSTVNLDPTSSCSLSSDASLGLPSEEPSRSSFRYSRRSNADVLCRQDPDSIDQVESVSDSYRYYDDGSSQILKKYMDPFAEASAGMGTNFNYVQVIDSKTLETSSLSDHYVYEFELPQELCGRLIGRAGKNVKFLKDHSNATVYIKRHPCHMDLKIGVIEGSRCDVYNALELLRKKFPPSQFPNVTLAQTNASLHLPENTTVDVILSSMVNAGHFFLQQPTHPSYPSLSTLDQCMMSCYSQTETPYLPQLVEGVVCAATVMGGWYRAQVIEVFEGGEECEVKFVDYGGFLQVNASSLRQIRSDFMTLPFQATECYLAKVQPINEEIGWTQEASATFEELAQGQILQAVIVDYNNDIPNVYLYRVQGISSTFINSELVTRGFAKWVEQ